MRFAAWIERLGPFEPAPRLAVACSGGADSLALTLLAHDWARARGGCGTALIVDHGLRPESAAEAAATAQRLATLGIHHSVLRLENLEHGPALAARARAARYDALQRSCARAGMLHLLLGHHAADQAETRVMRLLRGSGPDGLAGMAALVETPMLRLLRPLLDATPAALRATLRARGVCWVEDPSNRDRAMLRARLRLALADPDGTGLTTAWHVGQAAILGAARRAREGADGEWLGRHATLYPEGFVVLRAMPPAASLLGRIIQAVAGSAHPPREAALARWIADPRPATLGGAHLRPAGRLGVGGWLIAPEMSDAAGRQKRIGSHVGGETVPAADRAHLPFIVRRTLPPAETGQPPHAWCWWPRAPLSGAPFLPARASTLDGDAQP